MKIFCHAILYILSAMLMGSNIGTQSSFAENLLINQQSFLAAKMESASSMQTQELLSEDWVKSCAKFPELCVPRCQRDPKFCATKLNNYLIEKINGKFRFQQWPLLNNTKAKHPNATTPMHGSYLTMYVNDTAKSYFNTVLQQGSKKTLQKVDFPNGSVIVKQNFVTVNEDDPTKPWLTVMWKLKGYCHADFGGAGPCIGGDWFWYLYRGNSFKSFNNTPALGKAQAFCTDCHGPVQKADWLWTAFEQLKAMQPATSNVPPEKAATTNVSKFCDELPINSILPGDVAFNPSEIRKKFGPVKTQKMFDCFSWRSFIALNWPAQDGQRGIPDKNKTITGSGQRVWESYREIFEIFQPDDPKWTLDNIDWNSPGSMNPVCNAPAGGKVLRMTSKNRGTPILNETHQAFGNQFNILVDQNGKKLHFEVLVNKDEFSFFKNNKYANTGNYDVGGPLEQLNWKTPPLHFPDNVRGTVGAIEIKAAWRVMCTDASCKKKDNLSHFYVRDAQVYETDAKTGEAICKPMKVGLVGLHIGHKTFWSPQWVWSTFEHVANVPKVESDGLPGVEYSLFSKKAAKSQPRVSVCNKQRPGVIPDTKYKWYESSAINCPNLQMIANSHPKSITDNNAASDKKLIPNQVRRLDAISSSPLNKSYPLALDKLKSPFANYILVNTQWPFNGRGEPIETTINMKPCSSGIKPCYSLKPEIPGADSKLIPLRLRNTTMETYQVSYTLPTNHPSGQASSAGCMQCHGDAGLDFSFAWTDASEEIIPITQDDLNVPPRGSYQNSCISFKMKQTTLTADCPGHSGKSVTSELAKAHLCTGDIANINGKLFCNPPTGAFSLTCKDIDVENDTLTASCLKTGGVTRVKSKLVLNNYHGVIENCNGQLKKGRC